jgi:hypothetical protein
MLCEQATDLNDSFAYAKYQPPGIIACQKRLHSVDMALEVTMHQIGFAI